MMDEMRGRGERRRRTGIATRTTMGGHGGDEPAGQRRSVTRRPWLN